MTIGEHIRDVREYFGHTRKELEQITGVSQHTIRDIENGINFPTLITAISIADGLKIGLDELIGRDVPK